MIMNNTALIINNAAYGNHERQKLDIFIPEKLKSDSGIILYIHGGGWVGGDKEVHHPDCRHFCSLGYVAATMNYRYVDGNVSISDELDDITSAISAIKEKCKKYGINAEKVILSGGSAGGHLSLMYAYTRKDEAAITPAAVCAYCPGVDCAAPDFLMGIADEFEEWKYGVLSKCCGMKVNRESLLKEPAQTALGRISPKNYVTQNCVPTAVFHGSQDELVPFEHIVRFIGLLNEAGVKNDLLIYENSGHAQDKDPEAAARSKEIIEEYAQAVFNANDFC